MNFFSKKIKKISAHSILDSRGYPTIECKLLLSSGEIFVASIPTGMSVGPYESRPLYDNDPDLFNGKGVSKAVDIINTTVNNACYNQKPDVQIIDLILKNMNKTYHKKLGNNVTLAVSLATLKAAAQINNLPLYQFVAQTTETKISKMPRIIANFINGGMHSNNQITMQEFCVINQDASFSHDAFISIVEAYHHLKDQLSKQGNNLAVGDEGGFASFSTKQNTDSILNMLTNIISRSRTPLRLGIDAAASTWYDSNKNSYMLDQKSYRSIELLSYYQSIIKKYNLLMLEDPFTEKDEPAWKLLTRLQKMLVIGDDLIASQIDRLTHATKHKLTHGIIIKPNQVDTISDIFETVAFAHQNNIQCIASHRSGETLDTSIVDIAVGIGAWGIKMGAPARGERIAKYNRYSEILKEYQN